MNKEGNKPGQEQIAGTDAGAGQQKKDYIGCVMSLISKKEIRYVGTLVMINSQDQTLVLKNVKSYGSEGRRGGGTDEVPPSQEVYQHIIFRAAELKDFYVIKSPEKEFQDPAIISTEAKQREKEEIKKEPAISSISKEEPGIIQESAAPYHYEHAEYSRRGRWQSPRRYSNQRGSPRRFVGQYTEQSNTALKEEYQEDYDFEGMNKKFMSLFKENEVKVDIAVKYDKGKSFYDSLSRGTDEKKELPYDRQQQMQINAETFNLDNQSYNRYRRGGYNFR